jgi:hypothetical protein
VYLFHFVSFFAQQPARSLQNKNAFGPKTVRRRKEAIAYKPVSVANAIQAEKLPKETLAQMP